MLNNKQLEMEFTFRTFKKRDEKQKENIFSLSLSPHLFKHLSSLTLVSHNCFIVQIVLENNLLFYSCLHLNCSFEASAHNFFIGLNLPKILKKSNNLNISSLSLKFLKSRCMLNVFLVLMTFVIQVDYS